MQILKATSSDSNRLPNKRNACASWAVVLVMSGITGWQRQSAFWMLAKTAFCL